MPFFKWTPGVEYTKKKVGASMEPWGTPHGREAEGDITKADRKAVRQVRSLPFIPTQCSRKQIIILRSIVLKAAAGLKNIRTAKTPESVNNKNC